MATRDLIYVDPVWHDRIRVAAHAVGLTPSTWLDAVVQGALARLTVAISDQMTVGAAVANPLTTCDPLTTRNAPS